MTKTDLRICKVEQLDRGLAYGEGCFETFRIIDGEVLGWHQHMERLRRGLACFGCSLDDAELAQIKEQVFDGDIGSDVNGVDTLIRVTVTGGEAPWGLARSDGLKPTVYIQRLPIQQREQPIALTTVDWPFPIIPKQAKFTSDYALALRAMQQWNIEAHKTPLICKDGKILSSLTANLLILHKGQWYTPDDSGGGVLSGVIRSLLLEKGLVEAAQCPTTWLEDCEAIMLTNSAIFAKAATSVDEREMDPLHSATIPVQELLQMHAGVKF